MAKKSKNPTAAQLREVVAERAGQLPREPQRIEYQADADVIYVALTPHPAPNRTDDRLLQSRGVLRHYAGTKLVSLEILDAFDVFVTAATPRRRRSA